ncbi:MAG: hypothetical protein U0531_02325 [Dehalococcoidia bacterium]
MQRKARGRGRIFYGCANYPTCNFTSWTRPQPEPRPTCGYVTVQDGQDSARCRCAWRGERQLAEATA